MSAEHEPGAQPVYFEDEMLQILTDEIHADMDRALADDARAHAEKAAKAADAPLSPSGLIILPHYAR